MVNCPFILKKNSKGITITELLIVVTLLAILVIVFLAAFKPWTQQAKARDSRRKSDLQKLRAPLEDYYNDNNCYPPDLQTLADEDYIGEVPKDPETGEGYGYIQDENCKWYRIYVSLEFEADPEIIEVGCGAGCGPGGDEGTCEYNYGVSGGAGLECCTVPEEICPFGGRPWVAPPDCENPGDYCGQPACCYQNWVMACAEGEYWCCQPEE